MIAELHRLRGELSSKQLQRDRKAHLQKLDRVLGEQVRVGQVLAPRLRSFLAQYDQLSRAVVAALHRVQLDGVQVGGDGGAGGVDAVTNALHGSRAHLRQVNSLLAPHVAAFEQLQAASAGLKDTVAAEVREVTQLYTMVQQAWRSEAQERALRSEEMQRGKSQTMLEAILGGGAADKSQANATFRY